LAIGYFWFALFKYFINRVSSANAYHVNCDRFFLNFVNQPIACGPDFDLVMMLIASDPCIIDMGVFKPTAQMRFELLFHLWCQFAPFFQGAGQDFQLIAHPS